MSRIWFKSKQPLGIGGRIAGSLFFLVFFGMGSLFCFFIGREFFLNLQTRNWPAVECVVLESQVSEDRPRSENPYRFLVRYEYQWQRRTHSSTNWSRQNPGFSDYSKAQHLAGIYGLDTKTVCHVNPSNPGQAVLEKPSLWIGLVVLFPLLFVGVGLIGIVAMWSRSSPDGGSEAKAISNRPLSSARGEKMGRRFAVVFFGVFFLIGAVAFYFLTFQPLLGVMAARNWTATSCTIISSQVQGHRSKSTTYSVDILYAYEINGREYRSNRYKFMGVASSGYKGKAEFVRRFPAGSRAVCHVNPRDPNEAVLERGLTADMWFGLIPMVFVLVGAGGIIGMLREQKPKPNDASPYEPMPMRDISGVATGAGTSFIADGDPSVARVLKSSSSRVGGVIFLFVFAAIWNGGIFFGFIRSSGLFRRGYGSFFDWFTTLFMLPFVAVGLVVIGVLVYQVLALFNPKVEASIQPGSPRLGGPLDLTWRLTGRTQVLRSVKVFLEGREEATYRRGTSTYTDKKPFLKLELTGTTNPGEMVAGQARITLPSDTVPSFKSDNNKIVWAIKVEGDIARWPNLKEEFEIPVLPPSPKQS